jgi:hypothetical protein
MAPVSGPLAALALLFVFGGALATTTQVTVTVRYPSAEMANQVRAWPRWRPPVKPSRRRTVPESQHGGCVAQGVSSLALRGDACGLTWESDASLTLSGKDTWSTVLDCSDAVGTM